MIKWIVSALAVTLAAVGGIALRNRDAGPAEGVQTAPHAVRPGQVAAAGAKPPRGGTVAAKAAVSSDQPAKRADLSGEYQILLRQSLFSAKPLHAKASSADAALALKGISQEGEQFIAFIEDGGGAIREVRAGEALGDGRVREITLHEVRFESGGQVRPIEVGQTLDGRGAASDANPATPVLAKSPVTTKQPTRVAAATPAAVPAPAKSPRPKSGDPAGNGGRAYTFGDPR